MFLGILNTILFNFSNSPFHLDLRINSIQIVITTSFVVLSNVGIKWVDFNMDSAQVLGSLDQLAHPCYLITAVFICIRIPGPDFPKRKVLLARNNKHFQPETPDYRSKEKEILLFSQLQPGNMQI